MKSLLDSRGKGWVFFDEKPIYRFDFTFEEFRRLERDLEILEIIKEILPYLTFDIEIDKEKDDVDILNMHKCSYSTRNNQLKKLKKWLKEEYSYMMITKNIHKDGHK